MTDTTKLSHATRDMIITELKAALLDEIDNIQRAMENAEDEAAEDDKDPVLSLSWGTKIIRLKSGVDEIRTSLSFAVEKVKHSREVYVDPSQMKLPFEVEAEIETETTEEIEAENV